MRRGIVYSAVFGSVVALTLLFGHLWASRHLNRWLARQDADDFPPIAVVDRTEWDFGAAKPGEVLQARFSIANEGRRPLLLFELSRSCACLFGGGSQVVVDPGRSTDVTLELHTDRLSGRVRKIIRYTTNDPNRPDVVLAVLANVQEPPAEKD